MTTVKDYIATHDDRLNFYTHAITNAHGQNHPEVFAVRGQYIRLRTAVNSDLSLDENFAELRQTTHDYAIPNDVCPVFKATYHMLATADKLNASA
ncbi:iron-sulfur cluster repair di-iron protein, ric [Lactiplantibacillus sp. WILCCON 0030]|uniref:Iron-sulfur cluster repair di-iron protein, ric n=2 Tax=Lactiplantibacillus brownii TaxID=3069269 RepID=A0ABU1A759_9LACO|nr:iron-sulfur cluster repair di-iron protein, ric [Lactiplantibacillus brownii]MDQ7936759.1 iron-sulfur cluster repair di-iron protein, ric [Lactiplantibacillus brownii]